MERAENERISVQTKVDCLDYFQRFEGECKKE